MIKRSDRRGVAIAVAIVMVFLSIVALSATVTSFQSTTVRRANTRSLYGFEAVDLCEAAISEAANTIDFADVFPSSDFPDLQVFLAKLESDDESGLKNSHPNYEFNFRDVFNRPVSDPSNPPAGSKIGRIFVAMRWPSQKRPTKANNYQGCLKTIETPLTKDMAKNVHAFKSLSPVKFSVLSWRRDFAGQWQDWGVLHYEVSIAFDDGVSRLGRTVQVDRMFTVFMHTNAMVSDDPSEPPLNSVPASDPNANHVYVHFIQSRHNVKTVILRS